MRFAQGNNDMLGPPHPCSSKALKGIFLFLLGNFHKSHSIVQCGGEQKFSWVCGTAIEIPALLRFCSKCLGPHVNVFAEENMCQFKQQNIAQT